MSATAPILALGLMSGTSRDGIDAALVTTDGERMLECGPALTLAYAPEFRQRLAAVMGGRGPVAEVERELTVLHAEAVEALLQTSGTPREAVGLIGFHGQTILHAPERRQTWQIGDGALLAELTGIDVVDDFRSRDVAEGGEGAPLAPLYHAAMTGGLPRPIAVLNLGGVANVTYIGRDGELFACDTGPASAMIDDWCKARTDQAFDADGALAAKGHVHEAIVAGWLAHPFFALPPPKSLDRNAFDPAPVTALSPEDGAATLTAFSAAAIGRVLPHFPETPALWVASGGGRKNATLLAMISERVGAPVLAAEEFGFDGDGLEAEAWAFLAVRSRLGLPITFPGTTGTPAPTTGGLLAEP